MVNRREFAGWGAAAAAWWLGGARVWDALGESDGSAYSFRCEDAALMRIYDAALETLRGNVVRLPEYSSPVLEEGSVYHGVWLECGPQEAAVYAAVGPAAAAEVSRNNHRIFFALQKADGQLPCCVTTRGTAFSQIQMVVPIAATAWELAQRFGDDALLAQAYGACGRWDDWLMRYRNTRGTGLCEGFCTWDTGMDNSPRWKGMPNACPDGDARICPKAPGLPRLCPDLSATVYGGRVALAAMARALGRSGEADRWTEAAETIRRLIVERLYDPQDGAFYDLDSKNKFVRVRSVATLRVLGEQVADREIFDTVWQKQAHNPEAFWAPYPFPSVALNDPEFVRPIPRNSWGGAAQALTALRAPRWMEPYGKPAELAHLMQRWVEALTRAGAFRQQMDPLTGVFTLPDPGGYSPAALVLLDFVWRLSGVREPEGMLEWNVRAPAPGRSQFMAKAYGTGAELTYDGERAQLRLGGKDVAEVAGVVRLMTTRGGEVKEAVGIEQGAARVRVRVPGKKERAFSIVGNARVEFA